jgi:hypothetical protein
MSAGWQEEDGFNLPAGIALGLGHGLDCGCREQPSSNYPPSLLSGVKQKSLNKAQSSSCFASNGHLVPLILGQSIYTGCFHLATHIAGRNPEEPYNGAPICLPDVYLVSLQTVCRLDPPRHDFPGIERESYPPKPLAQLALLRMAKKPVMVAKYNGDPIEPIRVYGSLEDAAAGTTRCVPYRREEGCIMSPISMRLVSMASRTCS